MEACVWNLDDVTFMERDKILQAKKWSTKYDHKSMKDYKKEDKISY